MVRGTTRPIEKRPPKEKVVSASIHNRFDVEIVDAKTGDIKQRAFAENVICDQLWTRLCSSNTYNTYIHYGNGSGTPSSSDTSLFGFLGYGQSSVQSRNYDYDTQVFSVTTKIQLSETTAAGKTLTEVGIAYSSSSTSLVTHAMLKDMNGNPVSLEKSDTDVVNIYATVFVHLTLPPGGLCLGTIYASRYSSKDVLTGFLNHFVGLGAMPSYPFVSPGAGYVRFDTTKQPSYSYDVSAKTIKITCPRIDVNSWNYTKGIKSLFLGGGPSNTYFASEFMFEVQEDNSWYPYTSVKDEAIGTGDGVKVDFSTKFGFVKNLTVYVDGSPVEATVDYGYGYNIGHYLRPVKIPMASCYNSDTSGTQRDPMVANNPDKFSFYPINYVKNAPELRPVYENLLYETCGISMVTTDYTYASLKVLASNDLVDWIDLSGSNASGATTTNVPSEYQHYRYWSIMSLDSSTRGRDCRIVSGDAMPPSINVHLAEAPAEGAVITADYDAICIGKDANHVFDFSVTFKFNEYNEG